MPEQEVPGLIGGVDGDDIPQNIDNCPSIANASQSDTDGDGIGDLCDDSVTGESDEAGACSEEIGTACEFGGDCCEGQFCSDKAGCQYCSESVRIVGSACRPDVPSDCCSGNFCSTNGSGGSNGVCATCPNHDGNPQTLICFPDITYGTCTSHEQCQTQGDSGDFNGELSSLGYDPSGAIYTCGLPDGVITETTTCCTEISAVTDACKGLPPPPPPSCDHVCESDPNCLEVFGEGASCIEGCCVPAAPQCKGPSCADAAGATDITNNDNLACDTFAKNIFGPESAAHCDAGCCALEDGGGPSCDRGIDVCGDKPENYCPTEVGSDYTCVEGCCTQASQCNGPSCADASGATDITDNDNLACDTFAKNIFGPESGAHCDVGCCVLEEGGGASCDRGIDVCGDKPENYCSTEVGTDYTCVEGCCTQVPPLSGI